MAVNRTNGGPGCSALEGVLQENGVNIFFFFFQPLLFFFSHFIYSLSTGALVHENPSKINTAGQIFRL
jgi:hypothetical protein